MTTNTDAVAGASTLLALIDEYAEARHSKGHSSYNAEVSELRQRIDAALSAAAQPPTHDGGYPAELRDYFAAAALQGWLASFGVEADHPAVSRCSATVAHQAYVMADAMLAMRESNAKLNGGP